jgi:protein-ribulosamine 3-kinase
MTNIPDIVQKNAVQTLERIIGSPVTLHRFSFTGGGCINHGGRLVTSAGDFFIKWNSSHRYPGMFQAEASGLALLKASTSLHVPEVAGWFEAEEYQGILLEFVESTSRSRSYWEDLGRDLSELHKKTNPAFGLDQSNYIGSLPQINLVKLSWIDFFMENRLSVQVKLALDHHRFDHEFARQFEKIYKLLPSMLPVEKPALIHGDLWSGNVIVNNRGEPCLIDPAVYYGHREAELAFTKLFAGFDESFYTSYDEGFALSPGFQSRADVYNLYPLLVHVNLFGGGYVQQVRSVIKKYV